MRRRTTREKRILYVKTSLRWLIYYLIIFTEFIYMTTGTWLKPIILLPTALAIAVNNNQYGSVVTGAVCGFLIDIACGKLFGYNSVLIAFFCIVISLLFELYLRNKFINYMIITAASSYLQCWLDYKFYYQMWNYNNVHLIFRRYTIKIWVYTVISAVIVYFLIRLVNRFLMPKKHLSIEEAIITKTQ